MKRRFMTKEDQYFEDKKFAARNIMEVHMTPGSASSIDEAQVYWGKYGVWEGFSLEGIGGARVTMDGGIIGVDEHGAAWLSHTN